MKVLNKYKDAIPLDAIYIGRPSKWGNPFPMRTPNDRTAVIRLYQHWLLGKIEQDPTILEMIKHELGGHDLVCFCAPKPCHGDILIKLANGEELDE